MLRERMRARGRRKDTYDTVLFEHPYSNARFKVYPRQEASLGCLDLHIKYLTERIKLSNGERFNGGGR
jgi:hypothetical protein